MQALTFPPRKYGSRTLCAFHTFVIPSTESFRLIFYKDKYTEVNSCAHTAVTVSKKSREIGAWQASKPSNGWSLWLWWCGDLSLSSCCLCRLSIFLGVLPDLCRFCIIIVIIIVVVVDACKDSCSTLLLKIMRSVVQ